VALTLCDAVGSLFLDRVFDVRQTSALWPAGTISLFAFFVLLFTPAWIYTGHGHFHLEGTWVDVSCLFNEGYGMAFPMVVAPVLALASGTKELVIRKSERRRNQS
jgi:hypothetical protein